MRWDWRFFFFQPVIFLLHKKSVVCFEKSLTAEPRFFTDFESFCSFLKELAPQQRAARLFLDGINHQYVSLSIPRLPFLEHQKWLRTHQKALNAQQFCFYHQFNPQTLKGFIVEIDPDLESWLQAFTHYEIPVEGIYSLPFEIGRMEKTAQLRIMPSLMKNTTLLFTDGNGGMFYRLLPSSLGTSLEEEIERTINYVCREFQISPTKINVLEHKFLDPRIILETYRLKSPFSLYRQRYINFQKRWRKYFLQKVSLPVLVCCSLLMIGCVIFSSWSLYKKYHQINYLKERVIQTKNKLSRYNVENISHQHKIIQEKTRYFQEFRQNYAMPLNIFRKLLFPEKQPILITQLSFVHYSKDNTSKNRLLIECQISNSQMTIDESENLIRRYSQYLKSQFLRATFKIEEISPELNKPSYRWVFQLEEIYP